MQEWRRPRGSSGTASLPHARLAQFLRRIAVVREVAVEHGARGDVRQAVVGRRPVVRRPLLPVGSRLLEAAAGGGDFDRNDAIEIAHLLEPAKVGRSRTIMTVLPAPARAESYRGP